MSKRITISKEQEVAHAVLRDTPHATQSAEQAALQYDFATHELRESYLEGFQLSRELIANYQAFVAPLREAKKNKE